MLGLAGCAVGPNYRTPAPDLPAAFAAQSAAPAAGPPPSTQVDLAAWWTALNDPELNSLIERALVANPDLDIALTRLQQARTYESVVLGHALPAIDASAAAGRGTGSDLTRGRANQALVSAMRERVASLGATVYAPSGRLATDNAAMIARAGLFHLERGHRSGLDLNAYASLPLPGVIE